MAKLFVNRPTKAGTDVKSNRNEADNGDITWHATLGNANHQHEYRNGPRTFLRVTKGTGDATMTVKGRAVYRGQPVEDETITVDENGSMVFQFDPEVFNAIDSETTGNDPRTQGYTQINFDNIAGLSVEVYEEPA